MMRVMFLQETGPLGVCHDHPDAARLHPESPGDENCEDGPGRTPDEVDVPTPAAEETGAAGGVRRAWQ